MKKQDRVFLTIASRLSQLARGAVSIVQPETLLAWYRRLNKRFWTYPSKRKQPGRPRTPKEIRKLVLKMKNENILWGNGKIQGELLKLGIELDRRTIAMIIADFRKQGRIQNGITWSEFIKRHIESLFATDFFKADTLFGKGFYVFFSLAYRALKTRKIILFSITSNPTREFVRQQMILFDEEVPGDKYLIHDNSPELKSFDYESYGTRDVPISTYAPNMNCFAERFIGSIRREALDWFVLFSERQIKRIVSLYIHFYNELRPHQGLDQGVPCGYESQKLGKVRSKPVLSGLHHHYYRVA
ncbi:MAG: transposase [Planctomycetes bacterium]|nr:transposase [Planctomycetota bacterium]